MHFEEIDEEQFIRRLRIVNNLIKGSEFDIRDRANTMKNILTQTEYILLTGSVKSDDAENGTSFNVNQTNEEQEKIAFISDNPDKAETIFKLEDHNLLNGAIRVLGTENIDLAEKFVELFNCDRGLVHCALLTFGDYSMKVAFRYEMGSANRPQNWRDLFRNKISDIKNTKDILVRLLRSNDSFDNNILINIINSYIAQCNVFDWRYYFVKYNASLNSPYSMYFWYGNNTSNKQSYRILMMQTEKSLTGRNFNIFLKAIYDAVISYDENAQIKMEEYAYHENGGKLTLLPYNTYLTIEDSALFFHDLETGDVTKKISIEQDSNGKDVVDRVELALDEIGNLLGYPAAWHKYEFTYVPARQISDDTRTVITRSARTLLRVVLPSGQIIEHDSAKDTFISAIKEAGIEKVRNLRLETCRVPLVSSSIHHKYSQEEVEPGVWIITHSSTIEKKRKLLQISDKLNLGWIVKVINN